jgi:hypothetical protein
LQKIEEASEFVGKFDKTAIHASAWIQKFEEASEFVGGINESRKH